MAASEIVSGRTKMLRTTQPPRPMNQIRIARPSENTPTSSGRHTSQIRVFTAAFQKLPSVSTVAEFSRPTNSQVSGSVADQGLSRPHSKKLEMTVWIAGHR
jgi:hypothetical protein